MPVDREHIEEQLNHLPDGAVRILLSHFMTPADAEKVMEDDQEVTDELMQHAIGERSGQFEVELYRMVNLCRLIGVSHFEPGDRKEQH